MTDEPKTTYHTALANSIEEALKTDGPMRVNTLLSYLKERKIGYIRLSDQVFEVPIEHVQRVLQGNPRFTEDDSMRYHITER